ncbi:SBBP repeat-containing protein [Emticicia agri]|uniref:Beta-propeller repeat protein n=1 Tax=Emticicia agri TaxID=2492393 RepID=A0A4Q5LWH1_9BACT|nr:SBBP repeat-containing protein [Emticicia agri]RYU93919.1 hypothetical protein EWM59_19345 [Emticicia agri]
MKLSFTIAVCFFFTVSCLQAQNLTLTPGNQGKLNLPRLNYEQILAIPSPESGSIVYDLTTNCIRFFNGTKWIRTDQKSGDFAPTALSAWKVSELNPQNGFQSNHIAVDNQGNIYITGLFMDNFKIKGVTYQALGYGDFFVIKYNNAGVPQWVKTGGSQNSYATAANVEVDNQGNVFFAGGFFNTLVFDGSSYPANNSSEDIFVCKLSAADGSVLAMKTFGGSNYDTIGRIFVDNQSNVYVTGTFVGACNFDAFSVTGIDNNDIFIAKCNANLQFLWVNKIVGVSSDYGSRIYGDNAGSVYITGAIGSDATFAPGYTFSPGMQTMFVAKYDASNGSYLWHRNQTNTGFMSYAHNIVVDSEGNAYIGGYFFTYIDLGGLQFNASGSASDLFLAKISKDGVWQWCQKSLSNDSYDTEYFSDLKITSTDELFLVCKTSYNPNFGFGDKRYAGNNFIFKFDKNGGVKGGNAIQSGMNQYIQSVAIGGNYHYLTGYFQSSISFGNISLASPSYNGFVVKLVE